MTIINQIKAEIERRITDNTFGAKLELIDILAWLDTLEEPVCEELNEEINRYYSDNFYELPPFSTIEATARHFANWQKAQDDKMVDIIYQQGIEKGKDEMREQMMKEAVESYQVEDGRIEIEGNPLPCINPIIILPYPKFNPGDKVKLIIIKEDAK